MMNLVLKMRNCVSKPRNFVLKMMNFAAATVRWTGLRNLIVKNNKPVKEPVAAAAKKEVCDPPV